jgi:starvation-inducible DNA-binding protein
MKNKTQDESTRIFENDGYTNQIIHVKRKVTKPSKIGVTDTHHQDIAKDLSKLLADESILWLKTKNAFWNVMGIDFIEMQSLFEHQAEQLQKMINHIAIHIRIVGHTVPASFAQYLNLTNLPEHVHTKNNGHILIHQLLLDHEHITVILRKLVQRFSNDFNDLATSSFVVTLIEKHEMMSWMLRMHTITKPIQ